MVTQPPIDSSSSSSEDESPSWEGASFTPKPKEDSHTGRRRIVGATSASHNPAPLSLKAQVESLIFASKEPMTITDLSLILGEEFYPKEIKQAVQSLMSDYASRCEHGAAGFHLREMAGAYAFQTVPQSQDLMKALFRLKPRPLSRAAQETLAIIAYREPVTRADIEYIRGLNVGSILKNLVEKGLIRAVGRKEDSGRPLLFATTAKFLSMFGLSSLSDLPPLESFQPARDDVQKAETLLGALASDAHKDYSSESGQGDDRSEDFLSMGLHHDGDGDHKSNNSHESRDGGGGKRANQSESTNQQEGPEFDAPPSPAADPEL